MISFREEGNTGLVYLRTFSGTLKLLILFLTIVPTGRSSFVLTIFTNEQKISSLSCQKLINLIFNLLTADLSPKEVSRGELRA